MKLALATLALALAAPLPGLADQCRQMVATIDEDATRQSLLPLVNCLVAELDQLKATSAQQTQQIAKLQAALGKLPGDYRNDNGKVTPASGTVASASFVLNARQGFSNASLAIDQSVFEALCARRGGCTLSLALIGGTSLGKPGESLSAGPCGLSYDRGTRAWSIAPGCAPDGAAQGMDSNGTLVSKSGAETLAVVGGGCLLADSDIGRNFGQSSDLFAPDTAPGFYLVAAPQLRDSGAGTFSCELRIE